MKKFNSINIIPFVDIMLVLFTIVLVSSTLIEKKILSVNLAKSSSKLNIKNLEATITITKDGKLFLNKELINKNELLKKIDTLKKDNPININCDKDAKFETFLYILDILKSNNFKNISIITKTDD